MNCGILSRQGEEQQYIPVPLQRLGAVLRKCAFALWYKNHFLNATILLFLYIFHCCGVSYTSVKQGIYVTDMLGM